MLNQGKTAITELKDLLRAGSGHVHFVGICGVGMAGLANLVRSRGFEVSGCDASSGPLAEWLVTRGIRVIHGHDASHITPEMDCIIRSAAVPEDAGELQHARALGIPVVCRGRVLSELLEPSVSVAVCGTHGKTTTSFFMAQLLRQAGLDPSWCIGGELGGEGDMGPSGIGGGDVLVVEADESDGTLCHYRPDILVVTNVEFDHMEHFGSVEAFEDCFRKVIAGTRRSVIYAADDPGASALCRGVKHARSFGFSEGADLRAGHITPCASGQDFEIMSMKEHVGKLSLPVTGRHNIYNALAAIAVAMELGLDVDGIRQGVSRVVLPRRRFERIVDKQGLTVISDYAHHPTEIAGLVGMVGERRRLVALFQPHRYTRTLALGRDFPKAFDGTDEVILVPVYAASEPPIKGGTVWDMYGHFRRHREDLQGYSVHVAGSLEAAWAHVRRTLRSGDVLLLVGAGDVERVAGWAKAAYDEGGSTDQEDMVPPLKDSSVRTTESMAARTTLKVGGSVDTWVEVGSESDLKVLLKHVHDRHLPFHVLGAGSNILVSDLGVRGVVARLSGGAFLGIDLAGDDRDSVLVRAGAGVPLGRLLDRLEQEGLGGLEFLEGIPGTVGGALAMNAGAAGKAVGEYVSWIRCLNMDGSACILTGENVTFSYRCCRSLGERIVVAAEFRLKRTDSATIRERRCKLAGPRSWMRGQRSAGSIFKNPDGDFAGRLIEQAGLKGAMLGGASVSDEHANVIVTAEGATASDVMGLVNRMQGEVECLSGIRLDPEIVIWE